MPYVTVGKENSGSIELYYEDHGSGNACNHRRLIVSTLAPGQSLMLGADRNEGVCARAAVPAREVWDRIVPEL